MATLFQISRSVLEQRQYKLSAARAHCSCGTPGRGRNYLLILALGSALFKTTDSQGLLPK
jgi:hypothetical protein